MSEEFFKSVLNEFSMDEKDASQLNPLVLAYVGDAVYEVFVRTLLVSRSKAQVHKLHKYSIEFVKAKAQSDMIHKLLEHLTQEEQDIVRRGRNAKSGTIPKNADVTEYKYATGFESLIGFLYLKKDFERLKHIISMSISDKADLLFNK